MIARLALLACVATIAYGVDYSPNFNYVWCSADSDCGNESHWKCCRGSVLNSSSGDIDDGFRGRCYDSNVEKCCDFAHCYQYQTCCNSTCCGPQAACAVRDVHNYAEHVNDRDTCTYIENLDMRRGFVVIGFPLLFGIGAIVAAAVSTLVVALSGIQFSVLPILIIVISLAIVVFSILQIISPVVFPLFFVASSASIAILSLAATKPHQRPELANGVAILLTTASFIIMVNPFTSNSLLGGGPAYGSGGALPSNSPGGVLGVLLSFLTEYENTLSGVGVGPGGTITTGGSNGVFATCTAFYLGYFRSDPALYTDRDLFDQTTSQVPWGLCSRGYLTYQLVVAAFITVLLPILTILLVARLWQVRSESKGDVADVHEMRTVEPSSA